MICTAVLEQFPQLERQEPSPSTGTELFIATPSNGKHRQELAQPATTLLGAGVHALLDLFGPLAEGFGRRDA